MSGTTPEAAADTEPTEVSVLEAELGAQMSGTTLEAAAVEPTK
jgi:hypothetical protein